MEYTKSIKGKLFRYFNMKLDLKKSSQGWKRLDCIICNGKHTMGINIERSQVKCFKCEAKMSTIQLLMQMEKFDEYAQAAKFLAIQQEYEAYQGFIAEKKVERDVLLPESYNLISNGDNIMARAARNYMQGRGFKLTDMILKGIGYCTKGEYDGYIIFPFYRQGKLVFFQGRQYMGSGPKMKNPEADAFGIGKSQLIYNEDALYMYNRVNAVESITNALTLGDNTIAGLGKKFSDYQISKIINSPCKWANIILDPDAMKEALELGLKLIGHKRVKVNELPLGYDVNDLGRRKTLRIVKATPEFTFQDLIDRKLNLQ